MSHALGATYLYKASETCDGIVANFLLSLQAENPDHVKKFTISIPKFETETNSLACERKTVFHNIFYLKAN